MSINFLKNKGLIILIIVSLFITGCASAPPLKLGNEIVPPEPIYGNTGEFMSPYTEDEVLAEWVDKAVNAKAGAQIGGAIGAYAGSKALEMIPFVGGIMGQYAGEQIGRQIAITAAGGMEFIVSSSDLSFNNLDNLSVFLYAKYSTSEHFQDALDATMEIYPDLKTLYFPAISKASSQAPSAAEVARLRELQENNDQEDEETKVVKLKLIKSDGEVIKSQTILPVSGENNQTEESSDNKTDETATHNLNQPEQLSKSTKTTSTNTTTKGEIIKETMVTEASTEETTVDSEENVEESVNNSEYSGSYGSTTSKKTTIVTTTTVPGEKTIIYREIRVNK
jgi:hypothetical protein